MESFVRGLPKAELHVHIEGTLEPEMLFDLAARNGVDLPYATVDELRDAYEFDDLQSFLDIYYRGAEVLQTADDFAALMAAYLERAVSDGVRHAEIFFDPQTHTGRGVSIDTVIEGLARAQDAAAGSISSSLILCFLRHLPPRSALDVLEAAMSHRDRFIGVGLDSSEAGYPPELFTEPYGRARVAGLHLVAHAGEEGPAEYVRSALDVLGAERIDHGVRAEEDPALIDRLVAERIPLTMCPLSNLRLKVVEDLRDHNLKRLLERGVNVSINSDDPAYFGGYIVDNYLAVAEALGLGREHLIQVARNSIEASFLPASRKTELMADIDAYVA